MGEIVSYQRNTEMERKLVTGWMSRPAYVCLHAPLNHKQSWSGQPAVPEALVPTPFWVICHCKEVPVCQLPYETHRQTVRRAGRTDRSRPSDPTQTDVAAVWVIPATGPDGSRSALPLVSDLVSDATQRTAEFNHCPSISADVTHEHKSSLVPVQHVRES